MRYRRQHTEYRRSAETRRSRQTLNVAVWMVLLAIVAVPSVAFSEDVFESRAGREQQILESIEREELEKGRNSKDLIAPLTELSLFHGEFSDYVPAYAAIDRLRQVIRTNYGLFALELAPSLRLLRSLEEARGNVQAAWEIEQELLTVAGRHRDDLRTVRILHETADRRMDVLRRYDRGEFPQEVVLGCYYKDAVESRDAWLAASGPLTSLVGARNRNSCASGSRSRVRRSLLAEAQKFYSEAVNIILRHERYSSNELRELLVKLIDSSHRYGNPELGRRSLLYLVAYENTNSDAWLVRIEALVQLADWDLLYSNSGNQNEAALEIYKEAYDLLIEHEVSNESILRIFSPAIPVVLPAFAASPFASRGLPAATEYIDIAFVISDEGKCDAIEVLHATANVTRTAERELIQLLKRSRFRPRVIDGRFVDSAPIVVRYYQSD